MHICVPTVTYTMHLIWTGCYIYPNPLPLKSSLKVKKASFFSFTRYMKSCRERKKLKCILGSVENGRKVSKSQQGWKKSDVFGLYLKVTN